MYCICGKVNTPKTEEANAQNEKDRRATIDTMLSNVRQVLLTGRRGGTCAETKRNSRKASALVAKSKIGIRTFRRTVAQGLHIQRQNVRVEAHSGGKWVDGSNPRPNQERCNRFLFQKEKSKDQWQLCQVNKDGDTIPAVQHPSQQAEGKTLHEETPRSYERDTKSPAEPSFTLAQQRFIHSNLAVDMQGLVSVLKARSKMRAKAFSRAVSGLLAERPRSRRRERTPHTLVNVFQRFPPVSLFVPSVVSSS